MFNLFKKKRKDLYFLGKYAGHNWYRARSFDENMAERYWGYQNLLTQFDQINMTSEQLNNFLTEAKALSDANKYKDLHTLLVVFGGYLEASEKANIIFSLVNFYVFIDDEPTDKISLAHSDLKKELFEKHDQIKVFFCEFYSILLNKPDMFTEGLKIYEFLKQRVVQVTESIFLKAIQKDVTQT